MVASPNFSPTPSPKPPRDRSLPPPDPGTEIPLNRFECGQHVLDDVVGMVKADRQAQQAFADAELAALRRRQPLMSGRRRMGNEALGVAEIVADAHDLE